MLFYYLRISCLLLLPLFLSGNKLSNQIMEETCDNAIDDDDDGLIDLNDPDCECQLADPISLIPNPSFEEMNCCPDFRSQLHCADTWIQASEPTTDYIHTCGWIGWDGLPVPLPLPDGEACVGYRNGRFGDEVRPNWKEYTGACLLSPLEAGTTYRFEFYLGFTHSLNSPGTNVVFYGSTDCNNLPFGQGDDAFGCPLNGPGWKQLGSVYGFGANEWLEKEITLRPTEDIYAIVIGPDCTELNRMENTYYFFDNLVLASEASFEFGIRATNHPCENTFTLEVPDYDTLQYQWYKDGIALLGETAADLNVKTGEGEYQVRIISATECKLARPFNHKIDVFEETISATICAGETYSFEGQSVTESGIYIDTLKTANNCDSIIQLTLDVVEDQADSIVARIFKGESFPVGQFSYNLPGQYLSQLDSEIGCDSFVYLDLDFYSVYAPNAFSPNDDGRNDVFKLFGGADLLQVSSLKVFDRWGGTVYEAIELDPQDYNAGWNGKINGENAPTGIYTYLAYLLLDDGQERQLSGSVLLIK